MSKKKKKKKKKKKNTNQTHPKYLNNKPNHGFIINNIKPSQQIVQVRGNERVVSREDWSNVFSVKTSNGKSNDDSINVINNWSQLDELHNCETSNGTFNDEINWDAENDDSIIFKKTDHLSLLQPNNKIN